MQAKSCFKVFLIVFISMIIILLPNMIINHGVFLFAADYYFQQIPFYTHAVEVVQNHEIGWDWYTDLGTDFLISYGFYLLGSVFFWIITLFKSDYTVYLMPFMIAFKTAVGAIGAFAYISRFVKNSRIASWAALMYAFSGFQMVSLVFNHFHDVTALFPFLLLSFELLVLEKKRMFFAFMVCLLAVTNYFFFVGIVFFVLIYYIVKCIKKEFCFTIRDFLIIALESFIGIGMAAIILVPTFKVLSSAERVSDLLYGVDLISYNDNTIVPKILQSFFVLPDPPASGLLFKSMDNTHNWASISLYIPFFTITGVVVYLKNNKNSWISLLLVIFFVMALIPGLNSIFCLFNSSYYARWYYMPVLIMCLATAKTLEEKKDLTSGIKLASVGIAILAFIACLPNEVVKESEKAAMILEPERIPEKELKMFSMSPAPIAFWQYLAFSVIFLLLVYVFNVKKNQDDSVYKKYTAIIVASVIITNIIYLDNSVSGLRFEREDELPYKLLKQVPEFNDDSHYRIAYIYGEGYDNISMTWPQMNISCFISILPNETDFYYLQTQGKNRQMVSKFDQNDYPSYGLLSVKYILNISTGDDLNVEFKRVDLNGFSLYDKQGMYYIYKNDYYIPFGSVYNYYLDEEKLEQYINDNIEPENKFQYKKLLMMRALVLDKEDINNYKNYIEPLPDSMYDSLDENTYLSDCDYKRNNSCSSFEYDSRGYSAEINVDHPSLVYFSVPCSAGWSAKVNGKETEVIKAHYGLTAVAVESGDNKIEFSYETPGLKEGKTITFLSLSVFVLYCLLNITMAKKKRK